MARQQDRKPSSSSLLILSPTTLPITSAALKAAYQDPITAALQHIWQQQQSNQEHGRPGTAILDILVPCPFLWEQRTAPRTALFASVQSLVAGLYKLVTVLAARDSIELDGVAGIDARVLLLSCPEAGRNAVQARTGGANADDDDDGGGSAPSSCTIGPIINIQTLADSKRTWGTIYAQQDDIASTLCTYLIQSSSNSPRVQELPRGSTTAPEGAPQDTQPARASNAMRHHHVAVGGTFDHLHVGHKLLLTMFAFALDPPEPPPRSPTPNHRRTQRPKGILTIGITGDELLKRKKYAEVLEDWPVRRDSVQHFLEAIMDFRPLGKRTVHTEERNDGGANGHSVKASLDDLVIDCVEIWDPFGPTITDESISVLVLSGETRSGGKAVNAKRNERGWPDLEVLEVDVLDAQDSAEQTSSLADESWKNKISSTELRKAHLEKLRGRNMI